MASGHPDRIASIPAESARLALEKVGLTIDNIDLIEINEAFAAVPLVSTLIMAGGDRDKAEEVRAKTNVNGGAIAIGHPTGVLTTAWPPCAAALARPRRSLLK
jgi:acetyl-CoA C-acetyltransferase